MSAEILDSRYAGRLLIIDPIVKVVGDSFGLQRVANEITANMVFSRGQWLSGIVPSVPSGDETIETHEEVCFRSAHAEGSHELPVRIEHPEADPALQLRQGEGELLLPLR